MTTMTTMTTTSNWAEEAARVHALRLAMCEWRADPVGGRTRLVKDIAREHNAPDPVITRVYLRVGAGLRPNALAFQDLDDYIAAWRDALVQELAAVYCAKAIRACRSIEARFLAKHPLSTATINKEHAHRTVGRRIEPATGSLFYH
jgi:hypothetical protein